MLLGAYGLTYDRKVEHIYEEIKQKEGQGKLTRSGESGLQRMTETDIGLSLNVTLKCMWDSVCHFHLHLRMYVLRVSSDKH